MTWRRRKQKVRRASLLSCRTHGDIYLVVPGVSRHDALVAQHIRPLKSEVPSVQPGEKFGICPLDCREELRYGPVPRPVGRYS